MSFASEQYLKWAESQFEQTGIEQNRFINIGFARKYKRESPTLSAEAIKSYEIINGRGSIGEKEQEKRLDQYHKDCETMTEPQARENYLNKKK